MDAGRRCEPPIGDTKLFLLLTMKALIRTLAFSCSSPLVMGRGTNDTCPYSGLRNGRGTLSLGNTKYFWQQTCLPFATAGDINFITLNRTHFWFFSGKNTISIFQSCSLHKYPWKTISEQRRSVPLLARHAEMQENGRKPSLNRVIFSWEIFLGWAFGLFSLPDVLLEF